MPLPPLLERCHHRQQLLVVDRMIQLCTCKLPRIEIDWVQVPVGYGLRQDAAQGKVGGVCFDCQGLGGLEVFHNGSCCEGLLQSSKGLLCLRRLGKFGCFASKGGERGSEGRVVVDEIPVSKPQV